MLLMLVGGIVDSLAGMNAIKTIVIPCRDRLAAMIVMDYLVMDNLVTESCYIC